MDENRMLMEAGVHAERLTRNVPCPRAGIVHFGPGAFFRAFNAIFTQEAMETSGGDWGIVAVSLRSTGPRDQLLPQGCTYTAVELGPDGTHRQVINAIVGCLVAPESPEDVLDVLTRPETRIISLTVTEKGYCHDPATGLINLEHPDIIHDLESPETPRSVPGFIVEALARRRTLAHGPFTVLSCDNLPSNGKVVKGIVLEFARARDEELAKWISEYVSFPSTMVDRITPATTSDDKNKLESMKGIRDEALVVHEPFRQWVIEDDFCNGRPNWGAAGGQMVRSVEAHELMKLRCLNGAHSTLAYLGYLGGYETIAETVADPAFARLCQKLWSDEILPTVPRPEGEDLQAYVAALLERFQNPSIRHRTWQIAMDGSQKLPQRLLGTISDNLDRGCLPKRLCLAVAAWMRYVGAVDEKGQEIDVRDPLSGELRAALNAANSRAEKVAALLAFKSIFPEDLAANAGFASAVTDAYQFLAEYGARRTVEEYSK